MTTKLLITEPNPAISIGFLGAHDQHGLVPSLASVGLRVIDFGSRGTASSHQDRFQNSAGIEFEVDLTRLSELDAVVLSLPAVLTQACGADTTSLALTARLIGPQLRQGQLVMVTGQVPPGTTRNVVLPNLNANPQKSQRTLLLAYAVKRSDGAWILGGADAASSNAATRLFSRITSTVVEVASLEAAEVCGAIGAVSRAVISALANELRTVCHRMGVAVWEVLEASAEKDLIPTPGGLDSTLLFFTWGMRHFGASTRFIELANDVNKAMPAYIVARIADALNDSGRALRGSKTSIIGLIDQNAPNDPRASPAFEIIDLLLRKGAHVSYNDPHHPSLANVDQSLHSGMESTPLSEAYLAEQDCVIIVTDHVGCDYELIVHHSRLVIDTRNATRAVTIGREKIILV